jgi:ABC-type Fe3+-siderophore transport system permease subunit
MAQRQKSAGTRHGWLKNAVATLSMLAVAAGAAAGAYLGLLWGGLGVAFIGALIGGALGFGIIYAIANIIRQNSGLFTLLLTLVVIAAVAVGLHALGSHFGFNPQ